jgi:hypothetical protein
MMIIILRFVRYNFNFVVREFDSVVLRSSIPLKLPFLFCRTHLLHINILVSHILLLPSLVTARLNVFLIHSRSLLPHPSVYLCI